MTTISNLNNSNLYIAQAAAGGNPKTPSPDECTDLVTEFLKSLALTKLIRQVSPLVQECKTEAACLL